MSMTDRRIGVAIIGAGMGATPHAASLADLAGRARVVGVHSRSPEGRRRLCTRFGFPEAPDLDALLAEPAVSGVLVLTPSNLHLDMARRAIAAGKHVLVEKPLDVSLSRAEELVGLAEAHGVELGIMLQYRARPSSRRMRELIASGELGRLVTASLAVDWWRPQTYYDEPGRGTLARDGGGVLITQAIHALDLFQSLAGPVAEVSCFTATSPAHRMECEDVASSALRFRDGAVGSFRASTAIQPGFPERMTLTFEKGTLVLVGQDLRVFRPDGTEEHHTSGPAHGGGADPMAFSHEHHRTVISAFLDAIEGKGPMVVTGRDALAVHRLIDALTRSAAERRIVSVEA
ncbi:MAG: Gfo/Idh/MocA family oxidoreductase [Alsobacter sp.]